MSLDGCTCLLKDDFINHIGFGLVPVNSYDPIGRVSSPNYTFFSYTSLTKR